MSAQIEHAVALLRAGELIGLPTETVYGLAGAARQPEAIAKIFALKQRPASHPLIVHLHDPAQMDDWARDISPLARDLAARYWPGPLTLVLNRQTHVLDALTGGQDTIALRVPAHPIALGVLKAFADGVAAPSANRYQRVSPTTAEHVRAEFGSALKLVLDGGPSEVGIESSIVDLSGERPRILRLGMLHAHDFGRLAAHSDIRVPGSDARHYAPEHPTALIAAEHWIAHLQSLTLSGTRFASLAYQPAPGALQALEASSDALEYAQALYANLHVLSGLDVDLIAIEAPPESPEWAAINDRLRRASG